MSRRISKVEGPHPVDVYVGLRLRMRRAQLGMSQTRLADELGITFQQIQKYERGSNRISASMLYDIARVVGAQIAYFFEGLPDMESASLLTTSVPERHKNYLSSPEGLKLIEVMSDLPKSLHSKILSLAVAVRKSSDGGYGNEGTRSREVSDP
ncbi:helix-turn-helix domain-containing protein [Rhizobium tumorigenes]|uniref:Helix-turn-helix transcriptional regulator n=1 Tax=Rhizobium tumorigenes TaxID=2041385 RepID=A0AAF1KSG3_9HYPH|nr:helix-turn-helix transcriptional regulator [Rhizobium tumorigenes]WFR97493.1 helix-turn-helix transcriptional regulator [Rhizobium tumorigenes]